MQGNRMANVDIGTQYRKIMRFFWDPEPKNDDPSGAPIWCMGVEYDSRQHQLTPSVNGSETISTRQAEGGWEAVTRDTTGGDRDKEGLQKDPAPQQSDALQEPSWPEDFLSDFDSKLWFTYRSGFPPIPKSTEPDSAAALSLVVRLRSQIIDQEGFTSDTGWGCMIRSGQCILGNALLAHSLGRGWRRKSGSDEEASILSLFADDPIAPFSIHRFVEHGAQACGKHPGQWFGPSATARCIKALSESYVKCGLAVYITGDGSEVYEDEVFQLAKQGKGFRPVLILVGTLLGLDRVNPVYWDALKRTLQFKQSVGIAGGRPSASHYFVGHQGDNFFYLDPHHTRNMLHFPSQEQPLSPEDIDSCHTRRLRRIHIETMDPSMLIAFLIRDEQDWEDWRSQVEAEKGKAVIRIADKKPEIKFDEEGEDFNVSEVQAFDDSDDASEAAI